MSEHHTHSTPRGHIGNQEPSGQEHRIQNTTHGAGAALNSRQVTKDTAHATPHTKQAHR